jgi:DNA-binding protein HU-alpha
MSTDNTVTRQTISTKIATQCDLSTNKATEVVNQIITEITNSLNRNEDVLITGFGKFELLNKAARQGRNPRTGQPVEIAARKVVKFRPATSLKDHLTEAATNPKS